MKFVLSDCLRTPFITTDFLHQRNLVLSIYFLWINSKFLYFKCVSLSIILGTAICVTGPLWPLSRVGLGSRLESNYTKGPTFSDSFSVPKSKTDISSNLMKSPDDRGVVFCACLFKTLGASLWNLNLISTINRKCSCFKFIYRSLNRDYFTFVFESIDKENLTRDMITACTSLPFRYSA